MSASPSGIARAYALDALRNAQHTGHPTFQHNPPPHTQAGQPPSPAPLPPSLSASGYPPHRRIHVGYVSADWTERAAVGRAIRAGIRFHRRDRVLVTAYTLRNQRATGDFHYRAALSAAVERVVGLEQLTDDGSAHEINKDGVHILANLGGYTSSARSEIFALHPAPIQILLQGFAGTSGAPYLEYNVVDSVQAPPEHAAFYTERLQMLPVSAFRGEGDGTEEILEGHDKALQRALLGLPPPPVFIVANLNRPFKLEPRIFGTWLTILARTEAGGGRQVTPEGTGESPSAAGAGGRRPAGAHLWMFRWPDARAAEWCLKREMANASELVRERVVFTDLLPHDDKIRGKGVADLFLDTPEYNAHGTATEVLSGGVPVLTLPGAKAHSSRVASSVILALGLPELVARTLQDYENIAVQLARRHRFYRQTRAKLSRLRATSTLFDRSRWALRMERSYMQIWDVWAASLRPLHTVLAASGDT